MATEEYKASESNYQDALSLANQAKQRMLPVSVLISLKTKRIYVRQGLEPIMEGEISIENPEQPLGTHVYTALGYDKEGSKVHWNVVSLPKSNPEFSYISAYNDEYEERYLKRPQSHSDLGEAFSALERIQVPQEIQQRVSEFVWPGSSLIITDEEPHKGRRSAVDC